MVLQREQPLAGETSRRWRTLACLICGGVIGTATLLTLAPSLNAQDKPSDAAAAPQTRARSSRSSDEKSALQAQIAELTERLRQLEDEELADQMRRTGFSRVEFERMTGGAVALHIGHR